MGGGALFAASFFLGPTPAFGVTAAEKQAEADAALASLTTMETQLDEAEMAYHTAVQEQEDAQSKMDEAQARIDEVNVQLTDLQERLSMRARSMYRSGSTTFIDFLLGASTFQEFTQNWNILNQVNENDADMVQEAKDLRSEIEAQKAEYEAQEKVASEKAAEALRIKDEAEATVAAMQQTYNNLSAEAAQLLEEERAAREAAEAAEAAARAEESARQAEQQQQQEPQQRRWRWRRTARLSGQRPIRPRLQLSGLRIVRVGSLQPRGVRLLGLRVLLPDRPVQPRGNHVHVHGVAPGERPAAGRRVHELATLRHLCGRRPDDPLLEHLQ